jgi:NAD(P) transhydrogenase subunit beta
VCLLPYSEVDLVGIGGHREPLFFLDQPSMLFGDAKKSVSAVIEELKAL